MSEPFRYPESGIPLPEARRAIDAMRGRRFANRATGIVAQLSSSAKGKLEAIKVEALDRIVEVVSGNTPHASSASTEGRIASSVRLVKGGLWIWLLGSVGLAVGIGRIVCNLHESIESVKYRGLFYGLVHVLCGAVLIWIASRLDNKRREDEK